MRFEERLKRLKEWTEKEFCKGRSMKAPAPNMDIGKIVRQEPRCYLAWAPARMDQTGKLRNDPASVVPGIIIMPGQSYAKYMEEKRFDRYNNVHRPGDLGQHLEVQVLFGVYEPGIRMRGFIDSVDEKGKGLDMSLIQEGTEQGLFTLFNWMDDFVQKLISERVIPKTDLWVEESTMTYSLYMDQNYVVDRRPIYYGFVNVSFGCYADEGGHSVIDDMLN